jgi:hypothetical protein
LFLNMPTMCGYFILRERSILRYTSVVGVRAARRAFELEGNIIIPMDV